jgi:hypothetical protein
MGSYAKYQERLARARETMQRRKNIDLGREVMLVPLKQELLYTFQDAPSTEDRLDNILSLLVRKERAMAAAEADLRDHQDSVSVLTFFRSLARVRELERQARDNLIADLRLVGEQLEEARRVAADKKLQATFFMLRLHGAEQRLDELKYRSASSAAENEAICDWSMGLCALGAVEEGFMRKCLDATTAAMLKEKEAHADTRAQLKDAHEKVRILDGKLTHMFELYSTDQARMEAEVEGLVGLVGIANAEAHDRGVQLGLARQRLARARLTLERAEMQEADAHSLAWFGEAPELDKKKKKKKKKGKKGGGKKGKKGKGAGAAKKKGGKKGGKGKKKGKKKKGA